MRKFLILLLTCLLFYGFFIEPNELKVSKYIIHNPNLRGIRVVFISDFHIKPTEYARLKKIVDTINKQNPDVVLSAGGFLNSKNDTNTMSIERIAERLSIIGIGKKFFTVLSDEDIAKDRVKVVKELNKVGIITVSDLNRKIYVKNKPLYIAGVEGTNPSLDKINKALNGAYGETILLSHNPNIFPEVTGKVALILSGYTHGGQIALPIIDSLMLPEGIDKKYLKGMIDESGKKMIVTSGLGTSNIPIRFNCPPEIVVIDFIQ